MTFSEPLGSASIRIEPDLSGFGPELEAKVRASMAAVNRAAAGVKVNPLQGLEAGANAAANAVNSRALPAVQKLSASFKGGLKGFGGDVLTGLVDNVQKGASALSGLSTSFTAAGGAAGGAAAGLGAAASILEKVAGAALKVELTFAAAVTALGIRAAASLETATVALNGFASTLGTTGEEALRRIQDFAARTPFEFGQVTDSVIKLTSSFRLGIDDSLSFLTILGNAAAASGKGATEVDRATLAITQMGAKGRLTAQDLNQVAEAIPAITRTQVFDALAEAMGRTTDQVRDLAEQGLIPADVAIKAILATAQQVPGALGAMERQSRTFSGELSTLKDNVNILLGEAFTPVIRVIGEQFGPLLSANSKELKAMGEEIGRRLVPIFKELVPVVISVGKAFLAFNQRLLEILPTIIASVKQVGAGISVIVDGLQVLLNPTDLGRLKSFFGDFKEFGNNMQSGKGDAAGLADAFTGLFDDVQIPDFPTLAGGATALAAEGARKSIDSILSGSAALAGANRSLTSANTALTASEAKLAALRKEGGEAELAKARDDLTRATDNVITATERRAEAQTKLNELLAPATADELARAGDAVLKAEIALAKATRERDEAQKSLNRTSRTGLNLQGLSLDQLRTTLANARATLAAQRQSQDGAKTETELREDAASSEISQRDAVRQLAEARQKLSDLETKGQKDTAEITSARNRLADADEDIDRAVKEQAKSRAALQKIEAGESQFSRDLATAREAVATAEQHVADASLAQKLARADLTAKVKEANGESSAENDLLRTKVDLLRQAGQLVPEAALAVGTLLGLIGPITDAVAKRLVIATDAAGRQIIKPMTGPALPGFAEGGYIKHAMLARLHADELVLPLTRPDRVWELLSAHLPKFVSAEAAPARVDLPAVIHRPTGAGTGRPSDAPMTAGQAERMLVLLEEIAHKVGVPTVDVGGVTVAPTPGMSEAQLARKVSRELGRYLSG